MKPLTSAAEDHLNPERSQGESQPSPFSFPPEDEPVTMISKSIPPSLVKVASSRSRLSEEGISRNKLIKILKNDNKFLFTLHLILNSKAGSKSGEKLNCFGKLFKLRSTSQCIKQAVGYLF